jgi:lipid-A-disaccharide synthase-like uncharacterized protein
MAWLYFNTCNATFVWLSIGFCLLILMSLVFLLKLNYLELKLESKGSLLVQVWYSIELSPLSLAY